MEVSNENMAWLFQLDCETQYIKKLYRRFMNCGKYGSITELDIISREMGESVEYMKTLLNRID